MLGLLRSILFCVPRSEKKAKKNKKIFIAVCYKNNFCYSCYSCYFLLSLLKNKMDFKKTNSAVLKSMFIQMDKPVFIKNVKHLKQEYLELKPNFYNKNYEMKLWNLYKFCTVFYLKNWCKRS